MMIQKFFSPYQALLFFLSKYKKIYLGLFLISIGYAILECINISTLLPLFSAALGKGGQQGKLFDLLEKIISFLPFSDPFLNAISFAAVTLILKELLAFFRQYMIGYGVGRVVCETKEAVFNKYIESDYSFFLENKQGDLSYKIMTATGRLGNCLQYVPEFLIALLMTLTIGLLLFSISMTVTLSLMLIALLFSLWTRFLSRKVSFYIGKERVHVGIAMNVILNEFLDGIKQVKVADASPYWKREFEKMAKRARDLIIRDAFWMAIPERAMPLLPVIGLIMLAIFFKLYRGISSEILWSRLSVISVYAFAFYRLIPHLTSFGRVKMQIMNTISDVDILHEIYHKKTNAINRGQIDVHRFEKEIRFENICFGYPEQKEILKDFHWIIKKGESVALIGPSGSGKSTLVHLLLHLFEPSSGKITIDGISISDIKNTSLSRLISLVTQETFIFHATIRENILFGSQEVPFEKVKEAAKLAYLDEFITNLPDGYETVVGDKGYKLSGGQRQRIAIARAFLRDPQIIIFDEATSSLDVESEAQVQEACRRLFKGRTSIVISHRLSSIKEADKIIILKNGKVLEQKIRDDLLLNHQKEYSLGSYLE